MQPEYEIQCVTLEQVAGEEKGMIDLGMYSGGTAVLFCLQTKKKKYVGSQRNYFIYMPQSLVHIP